MIPELQNFVSAKSEPLSAQQKTQDIDPNKLEGLKEKLSKTAPVYTKVGVESEDFKQFIMELANPKLKDDKKVYDICLTCWQYQTTYKLKLHQMIGHEGIRGNFVKTQEDFLVLAKAYNKIADDKSVTIFAEYGKSSKSGKSKQKSSKKDGSEKKLKKREAKKKVKDEDAWTNATITKGQLQAVQKAKISATHSLNLAQAAAMNMQKSFIPEIGSLSVDQERILFNTQLLSMFQSINSNISNLKVDVSKKFEDIMTHIVIKETKPVKAPRAPRKPKAASTEKENVVPELTSASKLFAEAQKPSILDSVERFQKNNVLLDSLNSIPGSENQQ